MNVTEQSIRISPYSSGEILSARQKADNGRCAKAQSAEKEKRQAKKPKPRDSFDVDRNILVTETEEDFLLAERE